MHIISRVFNYILTHRGCSKTRIDQACQLTAYAVDKSLDRLTFANLVHRDIDGGYRVPPHLTVAHVIDFGLEVKTYPRFDVVENKRLPRSKK